MNAVTNHELQSIDGGGQVVCWGIAVYIGNDQFVCLGVSY